MENNINKGKIEQIYDVINEDNFIDLKNEVYYKKLNYFWRNENDYLVKTIQIYIIELNINNKNNFNMELEIYKKIIQEKFNNDFYTKENLEKKIDSIFNEGLVRISEDSKKQIFDILDSILNKIKNHISNEGSRLSNEKIKYKENYIYIKNRLETYKSSIYEQFYMAIIL